MIRILLPIKKAKSLFVKRILRLPFAVCIDIHADSSYLLSFSVPLSRFHVPSVLRPSCRACWYCDRQILFMIIRLTDIQFCAKLHRLSRFFSIIPEGSPQGHTLGRVFERLIHTEGALLPPYVSEHQRHQSLADAPGTAASGAMAAGEMERRLLMVNLSYEDQIKSFHSV